MKAMGAGKIVDARPRYDYKTCIRYSLSLPGVHSLTVTMPNLQQMSADVEVAASFKQLGNDEMKELKAEAEGEVREAFIDFMDTHTDRA